MKKRISKKTKPAKQKINIIDNNKIYIEYYSERRGGQSYSDEPYSDREPEEIDFGITKCSVDKNMVGYSRQEHTVKFKPKVGKPIYVVYVRYSSGDTFGHISGQWYIVDIFNNNNDAIKLKNAIDSRQYEKDNFVPWTGYFETLESSHIAPFILF